MMLVFQWAWRKGRTASLRRRGRSGSPAVSVEEEGGRSREEARSALGGPIPEDMLRDIAQESSQSERRADEAERELMEWKKIKFMEDRVGEDFDGLIVSVTKFGMFVELNDLFIEGLVPLATLSDDRYMYHENTRQIIGQRTRKTYSMGDPIHVFVDRIDQMQKRIQFGVVGRIDEMPKSARAGASVSA